MSYSYVLPGDRSSSGLARRWLIAYPVAQLLCLGAASAAEAVTLNLQWPDPSYQATAVGVAVAATYALTFGYLRGCVLREKLARFSMPAWCAAIAAASLFILPPAPVGMAAWSGPASGVQAAIHAALPVVLAGFIYGLVIGAAEAASLRRAAFGLFGWTVLSGLAWGVAHLCASALAAIIAPLALTPFQTGAVEAVCLTAQAAIAGLVMLPPLKLLTPRLSYYGPRVYREAVRTRD